MSHELRTPINGILGFAELLRNSNLSKHQKDFANTIILSAENLLQLVSDILDAAKLEEGKFVLQPVETNLNQVIQDCIDVVKRVWK